MIGLEHKTYQAMKPLFITIIKKQYDRTRTQDISSHEASIHNNN